MNSRQRRKARRKNPRFLKRRICTRNIDGEFKSLCLGFMPKHMGVDPARGPDKTVILRARAEGKNEEPVRIMEVSDFEIRKAKPPGKSEVPWHLLHQRCVVVPLTTEKQNPSDKPHSHPKVVS